MYQLTSGHPSGKIYQKVTKRKYLAYFEDYMAVKEAHLEWFLPEAACLGGYDVKLLDYSPDSLVTIWRGLISSIKMIDYYSFDGLENSLPLWVYAILGSISDKNGTYSPDSLWLMDGLAYYFGEVFVRNYPDDFAWKTWTPENHKSLKDVLLPSIVAKDDSRYRVCFPFDPVLTACIRTWCEGRTPHADDIKSFFENIVKSYFDNKIK